MQEELSTLIQAKYPLVYLVTAEEDRAEAEIAAIARHRHINRRVFMWTATRGMSEYNPEREVPINMNTISAEAAVNWTANQKEPGIYIFKDLHPFFASSNVVRSIRDAIAVFNRSGDRTIVLMSPIQQIPVELEKEVVVIDFAPPDMVELGYVLDSQLEKHRQRPLDKLEREKVIKATLGLTRDEALKVYRKAYVTRGRLTEREVDIVLSEKKQLIRRNGILEFLEVEDTMEGVGGLDELKNWLVQRTDAFTERARLFGLPQPKGMLILGVPGCGKSLIAKTTAQLWGLPLLRLDMGRVYDGSTVGRSEANLRSAIKTAESLAPAILFIDELDKAFAGSAGSADSDGGTSSRIFGSFLTWMQEKTSAVFVMATANRVERLPSEFLRKGRFDEIFFVDLPTQSERETIFQIHLAKRNRNNDRFDVNQLAKIADGFSGAEIEQALIAAMYEAFAHEREITQLDLIAAIKSTLPLSRTMVEQVATLREWAGQRARPAASAVAEYHRLEF
jgi:ATP-dependent 26S proteasome regulatory subunit